MSDDANLSLFLKNIFVPIKMELDGIEATTGMQLKTVEQLKTKQESLQVIQSEQNQKINQFLQQLDIEISKMEETMTKVEANLDDICKQSIIKQQEQKTLLDF